MKLPNRQLKPHLHLPLQLLPLHPPSSLPLPPSRLPPQRQSPAPAAPAAMATEQSGALIWCCQLGHPNDVPSYVPFFTAVSDHFGSKEPLLWRERAPIPQIGALNMRPESGRVLGGVPGPNFNHIQDSAGSPVPQGMGRSNRRGRGVELQQRQGRGQYEPSFRFLG